MAASPYGRVAYLLGINQSDLPSWMTYRKSPTQTPVTLSGCETGLSSYRLLIAFKDGDTWNVYADKNSATTNRHISATTSVLEAIGFKRTDELRTRTKGMGHADCYRVYRQ